MEKKFAEYEGGRIFYTVRGEGTVVVLVHGYLCSSEVWGRFSNRLAENYTVIEVDLPGNGYSSLYEQKHTMCFLAGAVMAVIDSEKIEKVVLVGHSLGGYVALSMVDNHPQRLFGYILFHSHPFADTEEIVDNRLREIKIVKSGKKDAIYPVNIPKMFADNNLERLADDISRLKAVAALHSGEGIISILRGMIQRKSREDIFLQGRVPLLCFLGKNDNYIPYDLILSKLQFPGNSKLVTLNKSGHMGFLEETDIAVARVDEFISQLV